MEGGTDEDSSRRGRRSHTLPPRIRVRKTKKPRFYPPNLPDLQQLSRKPMGNWAAGTDAKAAKKTTVSTSIRGLPLSDSEKQKLADGRRKGDALFAKEKGHRARACPFVPSSSKGKEKREGN